MATLSGKCVLIVEDEPLVAMFLEDMLNGQGCRVIGPTARVDEALALIESDPPDLAVLDLYLEGVDSYAVADALRARNTPFLFITGYGEAGLRDDYAAQPALTKPFNDEELAERMLSMLNSV
jgi:CheY-like chemotaxis protein